jgi:transcriptional regulator with XRE-family HTH domain
VIRKARRKNIVGKRVAEARRSRSPRLTQEDLSGKLARVGIQLDRAAVAKIENGHRYVLDYELRALAEVLGVDANWFLGGGKK